jgi:uncharacterized Zn finger protein
MSPDLLCPECHGPPELLHVKKDRLVKRCTDCRHMWNEHHEPPAPKSNYIPRNPPKERA